MSSDRDSLASRGSFSLAPVIGWLLVAVIVFLPLLILLMELVVSGFSSLSTLLSARVLGLFSKSVGLALAATVVALLLGVPGGLALGARRPRAPLHGFLRATIVVGTLLPPFYQIAAWRPLLGVLPGDIGALSWPICVVFLALAYTPLVVLVTAESLAAVSPGAIESARLSRSLAGLILRIVLPMLRAPLVATASLVFLMALLNYEVPALLFVEVYPVELLIECQTLAEPGAAVALALPLLILSALAAAVLAHGFDRTHWRRAAGARSGAPLPLDLGRGGVVGVVVLAALLVGLPLARLVELGGGSGLFEAARKTLSLHGRELLFGLLVSLVSALAAATLAGLVVPRSGRSHRWLGLVLWLPLAVPGPLLATALIRLYNTELPVLEWIYTSPAILVVAGLARFFPITYHLLGAHLRSLPREYWEAAALSSGSRLSWLLRIYLPLAGPGLALGGAGFLVFQNAELSAAVLVQPPGYQPVSVLVSSLLHYNTALDVPALLCLFQLLGVVLIMGAVLLVGNLSRLRGRMRESRRGTNV